MKFRAWDEQFKIMRYDYKIWFHPEQKIEYWLIGNFEPFVWRWESEKKFVYFPLMQYTWLKDIYESDIIQWNVRWSIKVWTVYWADCWWWIKDSRWWNKTHLSHASWLKVLWNVYENPDLLIK